MTMLGNDLLPSREYPRNWISVRIFLRYHRKSRLIDRWTTLAMYESHEWQPLWVRHFATHSHSRSRSTHIIYTHTHGATQRHIYTSSSAENLESLSQTRHRDVLLIIRAIASAHTILSVTRQMKYRVDFHAKRNSQSTAFHRRVPKRLEGAGGDPYRGIPSGRKNRSPRHTARRLFTWWAHWPTKASERPSAMASGANANSISSPGWLGPPWVRRRSPLRDVDVTPSDRSSVKRA